MRPAQAPTAYLTIGLVSLAHGSSHYFQLLIPPLFVFLMQEFHWNYAMLGVAVSVFFTVSGIGQALAGVLVDRVGARGVLFLALACLCVSALTLAMAQSYAMVIAAATLAGLGNCFFHPVDYSILNQRLPRASLGLAYSSHSVFGYLGWGLAPTLLVGISQVWSWRVAALASAVLISLIALACWLGRAALQHQPAHHATPAPGAPPQSTDQTSTHPSAISTATLLRLPVIWWCFAFFFLLTVAGGSVQNFTVAVMQGLYQVAPDTSAHTLTAFMVCGAVGTAIGGFLPNRVRRLEGIIGVMLLLGGVCYLALATGWFSPTVALVLLASTGILIGCAGPSRDLLVRQVTPPGSTGRVYGFVYSGLDLGLALSPPIIGWLLDHGHFSSMFVVCAVSLALAVQAAWWAARSHAREQQHGAALAGSSAAAGA